MRQVRAGQDPGPSARGRPGFRTDADNAVEHLQAGYAADSARATPGNAHHHPIASAFARHASPDEPDETNSFEDAPLVALLRAATIIEGETPPNRVPSGRPTRPEIQELSNLLGTVMLTPDDLCAVLESTERYWPIWPSCYHGPRASDTLQAGGVRSAVHFISTAPISSNPAVMAKASLWLALCIQQLHVEY